MDYSNKNKTPILIIEDEELHAFQVKEKLGDKYNVKHLLEKNDIEILNFKALNQESQIIIVDLVLESQPDPEEGYKIIREIWEIDRTTFFIVFSQYIEDNTTIPINKVEPHWCSVKKEIDDKGQLTPRCLNNLYKIVEKCRSYSSPSLITPNYAPYNWIHLLYDEKKDIHEEHFQKVSMNIERSVGVLNQLAQAASYYVKAGEDAANIAIVIYGSCGRLEMREDSDIECTVYFNDEVDVKGVGKLAVAFWNRITRFIESNSDLKYTFEGKENLLKKNTSGLLLPDQYNQPLVKEPVGSLRNTFYPVLGKNFFLKKNLSKDTQVRNRHFQILTETRPIFNYDFLYKMKREMISKNVNNSSNLPTIIRSPYMENMVIQFSMDTRTEELSRWNWDNIKRFCYRTLSVWALRLSLIGRLKFGKETLENDKDWQDFFDLLSEPGIVKVVDFAKKCKETPEIEKKFTEKLDEFIKAYYKTSARFSNPNKVPDDLISAITETENLYKELLPLIDKILHFNSIKREVNWLFKDNFIA